MSPTFPEWVYPLLTLLEEMPAGSGQRWSLTLAHTYAEILLRAGKDVSSATLQRVRFTESWRPAPAALLEIAFDIAFAVPGPEEAWTLLPRDKSASVVWTEDMAAAWAIARELIDNGERIPARQAFLEAYQRLLADARQQWRRPVWSLSLGVSYEGRVAAVQDALAKGRLSLPYVLARFPDLAPAYADSRALPGAPTLRPMPAHLRQQLTRVGTPLPAQTEERTTDL